MPNVGPAKDNLQYCFIIYGIGQSGKSTIIQVVESFFPFNSIATIHMASQKTFGLEACLNRRALIIREQPLNLEEILNFQNFSNILEGCLSDIAVKNKNVSEQKAPATVSPMVIIASNHPKLYPDTYNEQGQRDRRIVTMYFKKKVQNVIADLPRKIIQQEGVNIFLKCVRRYTENIKKIRELGQNGRSTKIHDLLPSLLRKHAEEIRASPIHRFLKEGGKIYKVQHFHGETDFKNCTHKPMPYEVLTDYFQRHWQFELRHKSRAPSINRHTLESLGFTLKESKYCVKCSEQVCTDSSNYDIRPDAYKTNYDLRAWVNSSADRCGLHVCKCNPRKLQYPQAKLVFGIFMEKTQQRLAEEQARSKFRQPY